MALRRLRTVARHVYGQEGEEPLWSRLMDENPRPQPPGKLCRCSFQKWRYCCRCYNCLEHSGRESEFEWTPDLVKPQPLPSTSRGLISRPVASNGEKKDLGADPFTERIQNLSRHTSPDGSVIGPLTPSVHPRFSGIATFARIPLLEEVKATQHSSNATLHVRIRSAKNLRNRDTGLMGDVSDPYVRLRLGDAEQKTPTINNNLNPVWDCERSFSVGDESGVLELEVFNANLLMDSSLGKMRLALWNLPFGRWQSRSEALEGGRGGELQLEVMLEREAKNIDIAVLGVPFDNGCTFRPGARFGPESVRSNSRLIRPYMIAVQQRPLLERQVVDAGDVAASPFGIANATEAIFQHCRKTLAEVRRLVLIGGDHTLSFPAIKAVKEKFGPVVLVHFDSHLDTFPPMYDQDVWHGSPFRCCWEQGLLAKDGSTHVGIRATTYSPKDFDESDSMGIATLTAEDVHERGVMECVEVVKKRHALSGGAPVYLSLDIDVLDPSVAPGTGTPEFGGLLAHQLLRFIRGLKGLPIVGADVVEVSPSYDHAGITAMAAANLLLEEIALINSCMDTDGFS